MSPRPIPSHSATSLSLESPRETASAELDAPVESAKALRNRIEVLEAQLAGVAALADFGILLFGRDHSLELINDRFAALFDIDRSSVEAGTNWSALARSLANRFAHPTASLKRWRECIERISEASWDELELAQPAGRILERYAQPVLDSTGGVLGRLEVYRDVSKERLLQSKLLQNQKLASLGQLISGIAHELNNPLTSISGYAEMLKARKLPGDAAGDAMRIYAEAERAARIVRNLLLFARDKEPQRRPVEVNDLVSRTLALRSYQLRLENIELEFEPAPAPLQVIADAGQLQQALLNLLINAEQALHGRASGVIGARTFERLSVSDQRQILIQICDDGPGIPKAALARIFEPFFTTKPAGVGTGLGLAIARGIVEAHSGQISAENVPGGGAKFTIELPASPERSLSESDSNEDNAKPRVLPIAARQVRILVVEDEPTVARLISDVLGQMGYSVDIALDSREGLSRALEQDFQAILCDLRMPHLDGRHLYQQIVQHNSPLRDRIVFMTGDTLAPRTVEFLEANGLPYLAKPFLVDDLKSAVERVLANGKMHAAHSNPHSNE